jgi:hypothetical protein
VLLAALADGDDSVREAAAGTFQQTRRRFTNERG